MTYHVPETVLDSLEKYIHSYNPHSPDEETEAQKDRVSFPMLPR